MTIEMQVREDRLAQTLVEAAQGLVFTTCAGAQLPDGFVDHMDVVPGAVDFADSPTAGIAARVRVEVFVVPEQAVLARPNDAAPATSAGTVAVVVELQLQGQVLAVSGADSDATGLAVPPPIASLIEGHLDRALSSLVGVTILDVTPVVNALGTVLPSTPSVGRGEGVVALRFGSTGPVASRLAPDQEWGVFLDVGEVGKLVESRFPHGGSSGITLSPDLSWQPGGPAPVAQLTVHAELHVPLVGESVEVGEGVVTARPTLVRRSLRISADWRLEFPGILSIAEDFAEHTVRPMIRAQVEQYVPAVVHDGPQSFHDDVILPDDPRFLGVRLSWDSLSSSPAGMTIGGLVHIVVQGRRGLLQLSPWPFGRPVIWTSCSERAKVGSGAPPKDVLLTDPSLRVQGGCGFTDAGALCSARVLASNERLQRGLVADADGLGFDLTVGAAQTITENVRILVSTARGTRLLDLGRPTIGVAAEGHADVQVNYLPDCLELSGYMLKLATGEALTVEDFKTPTVEHPEWGTALGARNGINNYLVRVQGLDAGETVTLKGRGVNVAVTADDHGVALVPAVVGTSRDMREVTVERASGRPFQGDVVVRTTQFTWLAEVGAADAADVRTVDGRARVGRLVDGSLLVDEFRPEAAQPWARVEDADAADLNPQPLPPGPPPGLTRFGDVAMKVDGGYAISRSGDSIHLFAVNRLADVTLSAPPA